MKSFLLVHALIVSIAGIFVSVLMYDDIAFALSFGLMTVLIIIQCIEHRDDDNDSGDQP